MVLYCLSKQPIIPQGPSRIVTPYTFWVPRRQPSTGELPGSANQGTQWTHGNIYDFSPSPLIASYDLPSHPPGKSPATWNIKESESITHQGGWRSGGKVWDHQSPVQHRPTHDPVTRGQKEFPTEAWPQQQNGPNSPGQMYLLSLSNWEKRLTNVQAREKNVLRVFCICQCAVGIGMTCCMEVGQAWGGGAAEKRGERRGWKWDRQLRILSVWISTCWIKTIANEALNMHEA